MYPYGTSMCILLSEARNSARTLFGNHQSITLFLAPLTTLMGEGESKARFGQFA